MDFKKYLKNKLNTDKEFKKNYNAWSLDNIIIYIKNKIELWEINHK